jgi:hypothetical protein
MYSTEVTIDLSDIDQVDFNVWCWIELAMFYSTMMATAVYLLMRANFHSNSRDGSGIATEDVDCSETHLTAFYFFTLASPLLITLFLEYFCDAYRARSKDGLETLSMYLSAIQCLSFLIWDFWPK